MDAGAVAQTTQSHGTPTYEPPWQGGKKDDATFGDAVKTYLALVGVLLIPFAFTLFYLFFIQDWLGDGWIWWVLFIVVPTVLSFFYLALVVDDMM